MQLEAFLENRMDQQKVEGGGNGFTCIHTKRIARNIMKENEMEVPHLRGLRLMSQEKPDRDYIPKDLGYGIFQSQIVSETPEKALADLKAGLQTKDSFKIETIINQEEAKRTTDEC